MARDEGINEVYKIAPLRSTDSPFVFPKHRVLKKAKKKKEKEEPQIKEEKTGRVDIKV
jgi:hypothetical protein